MTRILSTQVCLQSGLNGLGGAFPRSGKGVILEVHEGR